MSSAIFGLEVVYFPFVFDDPSVVDQVNVGQSQVSPQSDKVPAE